MNLVPVESSNILAIGYNPTTLELQVKFKAGTTYSYANVEPAVHEQIMNAESVGSAFSKLIKVDPVKYPFKKVS